MAVFRERGIWVDNIKKYLIVGASSDVGIAYIRELCETAGETCAAGIHILAHYAHNTQELQKLQNEYPELEMQLVQGDFSKEDSTIAFVEKVVEWGCPDVIVYLPASPFEYMKLKGLKWEILEKELHVEVRTFALLCKELLPLMAKKKSGKVAVMLTEYTLGMPPKYMSHYITAKYALLGFMKAMASEYGAKGININGISPAMMETKFLTNIDERIVQMNAESNEMKRNVTVKEVVQGIKFLTSEGSDYMSGVNLNFTGGNK